MKLSADNVQAFGFRVDSILQGTYMYIYVLTRNNHLLFCNVKLSAHCSTTFSLRTISHVKYGYCDSF